jgi:hypothetical protein
MLTDNNWRRRSAGLALALAILALPIPALALNAHSVARNVPYVAAFQPANSVAQPFSGTMSLTYNHGIVSGTYTDSSSDPRAPLANRVRLAVSGGVDSTGNMTLLIGPLSFHGTLHGQWIKGTATVYGRIYTFQARQGAPGKPAR